ncbi:1-deoxy-D-xylulose-5-phosphate synthase [Ammoniphilus sp. CFH 90114]|uniref:1-deoxy-D-xylulose-5-phosphate synthase n=1 Tax=Ammoniphilus sp. CFH 90114 TaxID=2493665 RepID=UPI00100E2D18|nr:1-deoxy-D-xylulose-5-phosphate synthase [Ammoniphilus sp. CFH 90114]RXT13793.1 1-deoxy-D-xylulose-5-phosphate synthase [Ammoniphilus sp. CFH 90114]
MLLREINSPDKLKQLSIPQMEELAEEIRQFLIEKLSKTGGHLASNLGVVELTLALHHVFNSPIDKFIWDVGHQSYVHKILTGRIDRFDTLRKYKGLSGFPKRSESVHDVWETGHSSTSLSAAMGMAIARDLKKENNKVVAIIGDGALTGGMAFEALNHIGHEKKNLITILNDNEMSIAPNVGAMHNYLGKLRTDQHYRRAKEELESLLRKIPAVGGKLAKTAERVKDSLKYMLVSGVLFEELGFTYLGPIDGHNLPELMECLNQAAHTEGPVLVHVITKKGKGYAPAEADSHTWHGVSPYKIESGEMMKKPGPPSYPSVFANTVMKVSETDPKVVAITPAMPGGSGLTKYAERFPDRFFDVGIAEQHAVTMAAGLATQGIKPVCAIYSTFLQRGYDQVVHDVARQNLNVFFAIDRAGFVGEDGETHHGVYDIGFLRSLPNMVIMMPSNENEFQHMIYTATQYEKGPVAVRYPRGNGIGIPMDAELQQIPVGKSVIVQEGSHVAILALGNMLQLAEQAAEILKEDGIEPMVVDARFVKPLDRDLLLHLAKEGYHIITVEEGAVAGGFGSAVLEFYASEGYHDMVVELVGIPDEYVEHGSVSEQRREIGLTPERIAQQAINLWPRKRQRA